MDDSRKSRAQLLQEMAVLRQHLALHQAALVQQGTGSTSPAVPCAEQDAPARMLEQEQQEQQALQAWESAVLDALSSHIAVLDATGTIVAVNAAWCRFADANGLLTPAYGIGQSYLALCEQVQGIETADAWAAAQGIRAVLRGQYPLFMLEYPCHSAETQRWFCMRVTSCVVNRRQYVVVAHDDITSRKQAEEALQAREAQTRAMVQTAVDGIITINEQGNIITFNAAAERMFGYTAEEVIGQRVTCLMPLSERSAHDIALARYLRTGEPHIIGIGREVIAQRKDSSTFPMDLAVGESQIQGHRFFTGIMRDITTRKAMEEALRHDQAFITNLLDTAQAIILVLDTQGNVIRCNAYLEEITGYRPEDVQGRNWLTTYIAARDTPEARAVFTQAIAGTPTRGNVNAIVSRAGHERLIEWYDNVLRDADGSIVGLLSIGHDVTERQHTAAALAESEARFRNLVEGSVQGILIHRDFIPLFVNHACVDLFGYTTPEEMLRLPTILPLMAPEEQQRIQEYTRARLQGHEVPTQYTFQGVRRDGTLLWLLNTVRVISWDGSPAIQGTLIDITARKRAEEDLQRAAHLALLGQLASGVAHEIGTPLNVMSGNAELLRPTLCEHGLSTAEVDTIIEQGDRITRLIEQLLAIGRVESPLHDLFVLAEPLGRALRLLETRFSRAGISVCSEIPTDLLLIGSADQFEQVFLNILVNAWHAMPLGGTITIRAWQIATDCLRISVGDTGVGMSAEQVARAFEPFYSTKGKHGNGLGLAMCQRIIASHHGTIRLESMPGAGTTVIIDLPLVTSPDATLPDRAYPSA